MKKKWAVGVLIALAIFILADVLAVTGMTSLYPSRTITCEQLLDPEYSTIYGLKQETSGMLLAEEDDPWIVFDLGESTAVRTVSVYTDGADGTAGLTSMGSSLYIGQCGADSCDAARRMEPAAQWGD